MKVIKIIILIVFVIIGWKTSSSMKEMQNKINSSRQFRSKAPLASFHKLWADINWMSYIQYVGGLDKVTDKNASELQRRVMDIISLDPGFIKAYEMGALMLDIQAPKKSMEIMKKGIKIQFLKTNWKLPFRMGRIEEKNSKNSDSKLLRNARNYYKLALNKADSPIYILRTYIRTDAKINEIENETLFDIAHLQSWLEYYTQENNIESGATHKSRNENLGPEDSEVQKNLLGLIQKIKKTMEDNEEAIALVEKVKNKVFKGKHLSPFTFAKIRPGELYCPDTGQPLPKKYVYGICPNPTCGKVHHNTKYCTYCGTLIK